MHRQSKASEGRNTFVEPKSQSGGGGLIDIWQSGTLPFEWGIPVCMWCTTCTLPRQFKKTPSAAKSRVHSEERRRTILPFPIGHEGPLSVYGGFVIPLSEGWLLIKRGVINIRQRREGRLGGVRQAILKHGKWTNLGPFFSVNWWRWWRKEKLIMRELDLFSGRDSMCGNEECCVEMNKNN